MNSRVVRGTWSFLLEVAHLREEMSVPGTYHLNGGFQLNIHTLVSGEVLFERTIIGLSWACNPTNDHQPHNSEI